MQEEKTKRKNKNPTCFLFSVCSRFFWNPKCVTCCVPPHGWVLSFRLELEKGTVLLIFGLWEAGVFVGTLFFWYLFIFFTDMQLHNYNCFSRPEEHVFFRWTVAALVWKETEVLCISPVFSQLHRVRNENVPLQTSSSSGRWSQWQGVRVGSHQKTPPSDVARADTALVCGRKAHQARFDSSNKVWDPRRDHCEWDEVKMVKVVFIFSPENPRCVSTKVRVL